MLFGIIPLSLSALIIACTLAKHSAARRAAAAAAYAQEQARAAKQAAQEQARRAAQEQAAQERAARSAQAAAQAPENHSEPEQPAQEQPEQPAAPVLTLNQFTQAAAPAPQPFKGHTVAFTGRLSVSGMTHAQAAAKVKELGGTAFTKEMPSFTTLLVVGENPGMKKQDKADAWISQVKKLTEEQFLDMLAA